MKDKPLRVQAGKIVAFVLAVGLLVTLVSWEITPLLLSVIVAFAVWQGATTLEEQFGRRQK